MKYSFFSLSIFFFYLFIFLPGRVSAAPSFEELGLRSEIARIELTLGNLKTLEHFLTNSDIRECATRLLDEFSKTSIEESRIKTTLERVTRENLSRQELTDFLHILRDALNTYLQQREGKTQALTHLRKMSRFASFLRATYFETEWQKIELTVARLSKLSHLENTYRIKSLARTIAEDFYHIRNETMAAGSPEVQEEFAKIERVLYILGEPGTREISAEVVQPFLCKTLKLLIMLEQEPLFLKIFHFLYRQILFLLIEIHTEAAMQHVQKKELRGAPPPTPKKDAQEVIVHPDGMVSLSSSQIEIRDVFDQALSHFLAIFRITNIESREVDNRGKKEERGKERLRGRFFRR